jgi:hypothetical protein
MRKYSILGTLLGVTVFFYCLGMPTAAAMEAQLNQVYSFSFDVNVPDGWTYQLTVDSTTYDITTIPEPDKVFTFQNPTQINVVGPEYVYNASRDTRCQLTHVQGTFDINGIIAITLGPQDTEYRLTFDQTGLNPSLNYYVDWGYASAIHTIPVGTILEEWQPNSMIYVWYPNPFDTPLGQYSLSGITGATPSSNNLPNFVPPGSKIYTISQAPIDFVGHYISGDITGVVFWDYNNNGIQDPGEPGIPNAPVELLGTAQFQSDGNISSTAIPGGMSGLLDTLTDGNGNYAFNFLPANTYYVSATLPNGTTQESGAITLEESGGAMNSGRANFWAETTLPYTGR